MYNHYEGTVKSAIFKQDITTLWGEKYGGLGYSLHVFIDKMNDEPIYKVIGENYAVIELLIYSDASEHYHYKDPKSGLIKTSYLHVINPLYRDSNYKITTSSQDLAIDKECTQRVAIYSKDLIKKKKHLKSKETDTYRMGDRKTPFYEIKNKFIADLWLAEEFISSKSSISNGLVDKKLVLI
jgi:hypothetical protein